MSLHERTLYRLSCDHKGCKLSTVEMEPQRTGDGARHPARAVRAKVRKLEGWVYRDGQDLCEEHAS